MEILLVEDSQADAAMTMRALKEGKIRHRLSLAADGEEALMFLKRQRQFARAPRPDLILLDLKLPGIGGRELLDAVRAEERLSEIPVVVMTSSAEHEELVRGESLQAEDYVTKPIEPASFISLIKRMRSYWHADVILPVME
jgi:CheY-like chemotaxis protein